MSEPAWRVAATYVALLRGINVGRAKRIAMADLRALLARLGYGAVRTHLNSGNVVFTAPPGSGASDGARIGKAIADELGVVAPVFVLGVDELAALLSRNPLAAAAGDPSRLLVAVTASAAHRATLVALTRHAWAPEAIALAGNAAYLWCAGGISTSPLFAAVNRELGDGVTTRNLATMEKLLALARTPA